MFLKDRRNLRRMQTFNVSNSTCPETKPMKIRSGSLPASTVQSRLRRLNMSFPPYPAAAQQELRRLSYFMPPKRNSRKNPTECAVVECWFSHHSTTPSLQHVRAIRVQGGGVEVEAVGRADLHLAGHAPELAREARRFGCFGVLGVSVIEAVVFEDVLRLTGRGRALRRREFCMAHSRRPAPEIDWTYCRR